ncbi:MAG: 2-dehydro-3-deoxygalactonokinase [Desulfobacterales bacterium]|nr:MAG: 2-dehydro-3-deoxygalactonokinase [Desulfobacterales bacterium]
MYLATIDCGTTNSRVYIVNEDGRIFGKAARKIGVRDTAIAGTNAALKKGLTETFYGALNNAHLELADIAFVISSGMITSEIGLLDIPHVWAPAGVEDLARNIKTVRDSSIFPVDLPIHFIRGIKNRYNPGVNRLENVAMLDFMRGEEVQVAGVLALYDIHPPVTIVVLSSHTKFIPVDAHRRVLGSVTTVSGQVYEAIIKETFIGKSIRDDDGFDDQDYFNEDVVEISYDCVARSGFLRTLLMPRFLDVLLQTKWYERKLFVEASIAAEDMKALNQLQSLGFPHRTDYILVGASRRCRIYEYLLKEKMKFTTNVVKITESRDIDSLSIKGAIYVARQAALI